MRTGSKGHIAAQGLASGNACWDREATSGNDSNEQLHASEWGGDVQFVTSQPPRPCPHCAMPVRWQPKQVVQIQVSSPLPAMPACKCRFLGEPDLGLVSDATPSEVLHNWCGSALHATSGS